MDQFGMMLSQWASTYVFLDGWLWKIVLYNFFQFAYIFWKLNDSWKHMLSRASHASSLPAVWIRPLASIRLT